MNTDADIRQPIIDLVAPLFGHHPEAVDQYVAGGTTIVGATMFEPSGGSFADGCTAVVDIRNQIDLDERLTLVETVPHVWAAVEARRLGVIIHAQTLDWIERDLRNLHTLWGLGLRVGQLAYNRRNYKFQNPNRWAWRLSQQIDNLAVTRLVSDSYPNGAQVEQTVYSSGSKATQTSIPPDADLLFTIRTLPGQTLDDVVPEIRGIVGAISEQMLADAGARGVKLDVHTPPIAWSYTEPPPAGWISPDDWYVRKLVEAVRPAHSPGTELLVAQGGFGDGAFARKGAGDEVRAVECGLIGDGYHGWERLRIDSVVPYTESLVRFHRLLADSTT